MGMKNFCIWGRYSVRSRGLMKRLIALLTVVLVYMFLHYDTSKGLRGHLLIHKNDI